MNPQGWNNRIRMASPTRRGSTLILALAILALVTLLVTTLSFTTRLEVVAARRFADGIQAQMSASTGVGAAYSVMSQLNGAVAPTQQWARPKQMRAAPWADAMTRSGVDSPQRPQEVYDPCDTFGATEADIEIEDESGKININASGRLAPVRGAHAQPRPVATGADLPRPGIPSYPRAAAPARAASRSQSAASQNVELTLFRGAQDLDLAAALEQMLVRSGLPATQAADLALQIILYRYGPDGKPGKAGVDDNLNGSRSGATALNDGVDNDLDGVIDNPEERLMSVAFNGLDDNGDGVIDDDREGIEFNGLDDDGDGVVDEADEHVDDPGEFVSDPRLSARGDDRPYRRVEDLLNVSGMTPSIYAALRRGVTVFSCSADLIEIEPTPGPVASPPPITPPVVPPIGPIGPIGALASAGAAAPAPRTASASAPDPAPAGFAVAVEPVKREVKLALNTATATQLDEFFRRHFPSWTPLLARQFAANIVDARDPDRVPTRMPDIEGQPVLGVEITPYINEVFSDAPTETDEGDDGQYVELHNPYAVELSVAGWTLSAGASSVRLSGGIPAGGYLVITDDKDGRKDTHPEHEHRPGYGSFFDIFGLVGITPQKQIQEYAVLDIPDDEGEIRLMDERGNLIDYFRYAGGRFQGVRRSFQRDDPRLRWSQWLAPTPLAVNTCRQPPSTESPDDLFDKPESRDHPFESIGRVLRVSCGRAIGTVAVHPIAAAGASPRARSAYQTQTQLYTEWSRPWARPVVLSAGQTEPDLRLLDVLRLDATGEYLTPMDTITRTDSSVSRAAPPRPIEAEATQALKYAAGPSSRPVFPRPAQYADLDAAILEHNIRLRGEPMVFGRLNVNTAPREALAAVAYEFPDGASFAARVESERARLERQLIDTRDPSGAPFERISDLFCNDAIFGDLTDAQRIDAASRLVGALTTGSRAFRVHSRGLAKAPDGKWQTRAVVALICRSDVSPRVISWQDEPGEPSPARNGK